MIGAVRRLLLALAGITFIARVDPIEAQSAGRRGAWLSAGAGPGWSFERCGVEPRSAACQVVGTGMVSSAYLAGGLTPRSNLRVGLEASGRGWIARNAQGERLTDVLSGSVNLVALWYPWPRGHLFLKVGQGLSVLYLNERRLDARRTSIGVSFTGGLGYDIPLFSGVALTAAAGGGYVRNGSVDGLIGRGGWQEWNTALTLGITID